MDNAKSLLMKDHLTEENLISYKNWDSQTKKEWYQDNEDLYRNNEMKRGDDLNNKLLAKWEGKSLSYKLFDLQMLIENKTIQFDEKSIYASAPEIMRLLIPKGGISAKEYLKDRLESKEDLELLSLYGQYSLEAIIIHVLSGLFQPVEEHSYIRVPSLIERLECSVREHAEYIKIYNKQKTDPYNKDDDMNYQDIKKRKSFPIGNELVQHMLNLNVIEFTNEIDRNVKSKRNHKVYYMQKNLFASCKFNLTLLPIKFSLPMVCQPKDWSYNYNSTKSIPLSHFKGGYLSRGTGELYNSRYNLLSSNDPSHFHVMIKNGQGPALCRVINKLQRQKLKINSTWLNFIKSNETALVNHGYLMPKFIALLNINNVSKLLRKSHSNKEESISKCCSFSELLNLLSKLLQRCRYEQFMINLSTAYDGYHFFLPAFLDFRGRIYRSGVLHFHERDLARSLLLFANSSKDTTYEGLKTFCYATAFHYKSFTSYEDGMEWFINKFRYYNHYYDILSSANDAKNPFQYISNCILLKNNRNNISGVPITQDASASAYQIMSYLLLDETLAVRTNLFPSKDDKIKDIYSFLLSELKEFLAVELEKSLSQVVCEHLTRKIVKGIFMPIIYGKSVMSTVNDLKDHLSHYISSGECFKVASACFKFWKMKYHGMENLIRLIRCIGWYTSAMNNYVEYSVPYYTTIQDYIKMDKINVVIYDKSRKKRHRVTLKVPSNEKDRRKTEISTFVNFIHQRDAQIAMKVVDTVLGYDAPIYTVHDNFITTINFSHKLPEIYIKVLSEEGSPLLIINRLIAMNIKPYDMDIPENNLIMGLPFREEVFRKMLYKCMPQGLSPSKRKPWENKIVDILTCYKNYVSTISGVEYDTIIKKNTKHRCDDLRHKWEIYLDKLLKSKYCLHH